MWARELLRPLGPITVVDLAQGPVRTSNAVDITVRRVCEDCNGRWMSVIETKAKAKLEAMILGDGPVQLSPADQFRVARWAYLKFLMLSFMREQHRLPAEVYREFHDSRLPLPGDAKTNC